MYLSRRQGRTSVAFQKVEILKLHKLADGIAHLIEARKQGRKERRKEGKEGREGRKGVYEREYHE